MWRQLGGRSKASLYIKSLPSGNGVESCEIPIRETGKCECAAGDVSVQLAFAAEPYHNRATISYICATQGASLVVDQTRNAAKFYIGSTCTELYPVKGRQRPCLCGDGLPGDLVWADINAENNMPYGGQIYAGGVKLFHCPF